MTLDDKWQLALKGIDEVIAAVEALPVERLTLGTMCSMQGRMCVLGAWNYAHNSVFKSEADARWAGTLPGYSRIGWNDQFYRVFAGRTGSKNLPYTIIHAVEDGLGHLTGDLLKERAMFRLRALRAKAEQMEISL